MIPVDRVGVNSGLEIDPDDRGSHLVDPLLVRDVRELLGPDEKHTTQNLDNLSVLEKLPLLIRSLHILSDLLFQELIFLFLLYQHFTSLVGTAMGFWTSRRPKGFLMDREGYSMVGCSIRAFLVCLFNSPLYRSLSFCSCWAFPSKSESMLMMPRHSLQTSHLIFRESTWQSLINEQS